MLSLGVVKRQFDDPSRQSDRTKYKHINMDKIEFSENGFTRHVVHNTRELASNYKLYVC